MKTSKLLLVLALVATVTLLSGCDIPFIGGDEEDPPPTSSQPSPEDLDFELTGGSSSGDLDLSTLPDYRGGTADVGVPSPLEDLPESSSEGDLYEVAEDGYAYRLDPATLEPFGPPLDPITHQEISATAVQQDALPQLPVEPTGATSAADLTAVPPTLENKYPNTGVYLEDD